MLMQGYRGTKCAYVTLYSRNDIRVEALPVLLGPIIQVYCSAGDNGFDAN